VHEVSMGTVDFNEIVSNLLTPLDGFKPFRLEVLEVLGSSGNWLGVETLVEGSLGRSDDWTSAIAHAMIRN
jgi:hypothetical protein